MPAGTNCTSVNGEETEGALQVGEIRWPIYGEVEEPV